MPNNESKISSFYVAFENKFRGSRELIKSRLQVYTPFLLPIGQFLDSSKALDLGCGRGEWLEILKQYSFEAQGVDLDKNMLKFCLERGLNVQKMDALTALKNQPDSSQSIVSAFHLIEHLDFDIILQVFEEAIRVLKPGGLLILETPNPENLIVGTSSFYLDPTHRKPIPPQLLAFIAEHFSFSRNKILRLNHSVDPKRERRISLLNVLGGVSPDYALVSQKSGPEDLLKITASLFETEIGFGLEMLANEFQKNIERRLKHHERYSISWHLTAPLRWLINWGKKRFRKPS